LDSIKQLRRVHAFIFSDLAQGVFDNSSVNISSFLDDNCSEGIGEGAGYWGTGAVREKHVYGNRLE
jgi:hypothetical protein